MKKVIVLLAMVGLLGVGLVHRAEARGKSGEEAHLKIGYVDVWKVIDAYPKAKEVESVLQKEQDAKQKEIEEKRAEINKLEETLKAQSSVLKEEEKKKRARIIAEKKKKWEQLFRKYDLEIRGKVVEKQKEVLEEIRKAVKLYGKDNGYTLIIDARQVLYGLPELDITSEVIKLLNKPEKTSNP